MYLQGSELLNKEPIDENISETQSDRPSLCRSKDRTIRESSMEESPGGVAEFFETSESCVKGAIEKPQADYRAGTKSRRSRGSRKNTEGETKEHSPRSRKDKVDILSTARKELSVENIGEGLPLTRTRSGRVEMDESRCQKSGRSSQSMDGSAGRRRPDRDRDMDESRQRKSDRSMEDSSKNHRTSRRVDGRRRQRSSQNLDTSMHEESLTSIGGNRERDREISPKRNSKTRIKAHRSSGKDMTADSSSIHSHPKEGEGDDGRATNLKSERRPRSSRAVRSEAGESGPSARLKGNGTRTRRGEAGMRLRSDSSKKMADSSDRDRDRRTSNNSKARVRERKEGRLHSAEETGRAPRISDGNRREGRRSLDESGRRSKPPDGESARRERRERVLRSNDTYIPPPSKGGEADDMDDFPHAKSGGPKDLAPSGKRSSGSQTKHSPIDMPPLPEENYQQEEGEQVFETTWQRSAPTRTARIRRSLVGDSMGTSPRAEGRRSMAIPAQSAYPSHQTRRHGRDRRGANVRQSQIVNMVLLQDEATPTEESEHEAEHPPGVLDDERRHATLAISASEHKESKRASALKAAVKASSAVGKVGAKAAVSGAKGAGKVSVAAAIGAGNVVKGVLGFRKKKKPLAYAEGEHSKAGLVLDDNSGNDDNLLVAWDAEEDFHGSGGTSMHGSGTSLHGFSANSLH